MRVIPSVLRVLASLVAVACLAVASGCYLSFGAPATGSGQAASVAASDRIAPDPGIPPERARYGTLRLLIRWPQLDRAGFRAATIPTSTRALAITARRQVVDDRGMTTVDVESKVFQRPSTETTTSAEMQLLEGRNLTVEVKAYRQDDPDLESGLEIARGVAAGINIAADVTTSVKLVLDALFVPTVTAIQPNQGLPGDEIVISGDNLGQIGDDLPEVSFSGVPATDVSAIDAQTLRIKVPAGATTGQMTVVNDGLSSTGTALFWVVEGIGPDANLEEWDPSPAGSRILVVDQILEFSAVPTKYAGSIEDLGPPPDATMSAEGVLSNEQAGTLLGPGRLRGREVMATTDLGVRISNGVSDLVSSNKLAISVEDVAFSMSPSRATIGPFGSAVDVQLAGLSTLSRGATSDLVDFLPSDRDALVIEDGLARAGKGAGYVTVTGRSRLHPDRTATAIIVVTAYGVGTLAGDGTAGFADGRALAARFNEPCGMATDAGGTVYVADRSNHLIRAISPQGMVSTLAGDGTAGFADGPASSARFNNPCDVAVDDAGTIYVADTYNNRIRKIAASVVSTLAGTGLPGYRDGSGTASFNYPFGLAVAADQTVYVADTFNHRIRRISSAGVVSTLAGDGTPGFGDGEGDGARFYLPDGIAVAPGGADLFVTDWRNNRIRKITTTGSVSTFAGDGVAGFADGAGTAARFDHPSGLAAGTDGTLYVADWGNQRIRRVTPAGIVGTLAGDGGAGYKDLARGASRFDKPGGILVDVDGAILVADSCNHVIRRIAQDEAPIFGSSLGGLALEIE